MNKILKSNYQIIIGIFIGVLLSYVSDYKNIETLFEPIQLILYTLTLLYFISFTFLELIINSNKDFTGLKIIEIKYDKNMRSISIIMTNENLLSGEELFKAIYNTITSNEEFKSFGYQKIIILTCTLEDYKECNLHSNVLIDNDTPFIDYYNEISNDLSGYNNLEYGYHNLNIVRFTVKAWNCSNLKNLTIKQTYNAITLERVTESHSKQKISKNNWLNNYYQTRSNSTATSNKHWSKNLISPISLFNKNGKLKLESPVTIFTMDLKTIKFNEVQIPIAISFSTSNENKLFLIDHILLKQDVDLALKQLWSKYFSYLESINTNLDKLTIFAHNLGDFDGYFLYKALMNHYNPDNISSIIDENNSFISIKLSSGAEKLIAKLLLNCYKYLLLLHPSSILRCEAA
jgi:hypothetical protein